MSQLTKLLKLKARHLPPQRSQVPSKMIIKLKVALKWKWKKTTIRPSQLLAKKMEVKKTKMVSKLCTPITLNNSMTMSSFNCI